MDYFPLEQLPITIIDYIAQISGQGWRLRVNKLTRRAIKGFNHVERHIYDFPAPYFNPRNYIIIESSESSTSPAAKKISVFFAAIVIVWKQNDVDGTSIWSDKLKYGWISNELLKN